MTEQVPSWAVTAEQLEAWGFQIEITGKCVGMHFIERPGMTFGRAVHAAWAAGFVRIAACPEEVREAQRAEAIARQVEGRVMAAQNLAFMIAAGRFQGPTEHSRALEARARERISA